MDEQQPENTPGTPGIDPSGDLKCAECSGRLTADDNRGEVYCTQCGIVAHEHIVDYEHPANHAYDPSVGSNPGRGKLAIGGAKLGTVDGLGSPLSLTERPIPRGSGGALRGHRLRLRRTPGSRSTRC
ncbi:MAG: TFIIB-type zinc ribbon-containing protein, partial [Candidatus Thermoplasmatota archaeon]|nr:TFIIB-type zinc ribbon-containing protein [Candidatus Thermoplasmatota archaeon]